MKIPRPQRFWSIPVAIGLATVALALPYDVSIAEGVTEREACGQTGSCLFSPPDICFVNGEPYWDYHWDE